MTDNTVQHDERKRKFFILHQGQEARLTYKKVDEKTLVYDHTFVPDELRGKGLAGTVVKSAFEYAREAGYKVVPGCSYVRSYLKRHPEYEDVVDDSA